MSKLFVFILFFSLCVNAAAMSRLGQAEVRVQGNVVCFTLAHEEFESGPREMTQSGYSIEEKTTDKFERIWGYYRKQRVAFKEGDCIPYGVLPEDAEIGNDTRGIQFSINAPELQINTIYAVGVYASAKAPTFGYSIHFCLRRENDYLVVDQGRGSESCSQIREEDRKSKLPWYKKGTNNTWKWGAVSLVIPLANKSSWTCRRG